MATKGSPAPTPDDDDRFDAIAENLFRGRAGQPERSIEGAEDLEEVLSRAEAAQLCAASPPLMSAPDEEQAAPVGVGDGNAWPAWHALPARWASLWRAVCRGARQRGALHVQLKDEPDNGAVLVPIAALRQAALVLIGLVLGVSGCRLFASPSAPVARVPAACPPHVQTSFFQSVSPSNPNAPPPHPPTPPPPSPPPPPPPPTVHRQYVPHTLIQYGPPRTATTLQHMALCVVMFLLHADEPDEVHCAMGTTGDDLPPAKTKYTVYKTHNPNAPSAFVGRFWLFVTSEAVGEEDGRRMVAQATADLGVPVHYAQTTGALSSRGYLYAADYAPIFDLTVDERDQLLDYLRYWDTLRQCCGSQMSADWRARLQGFELRPPHRAFGTPTYPACEMYDMDQLERNLLRTRVVLRFGDRDEGILKQVSNHMDPPLTGTYCRLSNQYVAEHMDMQFNNPVPYRDLHG